MTRSPSRTGWPGSTSPCCASPRLPRRLARDHAARAQAIAAELATAGTLSATLRIPGVTGPLAVVADLRGGHRTLGQVPGDRRPASTGLVLLNDALNDLGGQAGRPPGAPPGRSCDLPGCAAHADPLVSFRPPAPDHGGDRQRENGDAVMKGGRARPVVDPRRDHLHHRDQSSNVAAPERGCSSQRTAADTPKYVCPGRELLAAADLDLPCSSPRTSTRWTRPRQWRTSTTPKASGC
jgi:hypothetical protein